MRYWDLTRKHLKLLLLTLHVNINNSPIFIRYPNLQGNPDIGTNVEYRKALLAPLDVLALDKLHFQIENMSRRFIHESNPDDAVIMSKNVKTVWNVIEDESHFIMKVVDNDLGALTMFPKHFMGGGGFVVLGGRSSRESKNACGEVGGVEKMSSTGSKFMVRGRFGFGFSQKPTQTESCTPLVRGEECLEGYVGAGGSEVNGGGDDFGVSKSLVGEIPRVVIGESGGEIFGDDEGVVW
ncbi:hypothetical protein Tco_0116094 [Tanacetum coccineum]